MGMTSRTTVLGVCTLLAIVRIAWAGPPFQTDDPEPLAPRNWEFYLAGQITHASDAIVGTAPHVEVNYGLLSSVMLHLIVPLAVTTDSVRGSSYGPGDVELGVKYRFLDESDFVPMVGTFPHVEFPSGNQAQGLGAGHFQLFLPLWLQKSWGDWTAYGGGGYWFNFEPNPHNPWFAGGVAQYSITKAVAVGAEVYTLTVGPVTGDPELAFNIGATFSITENHHILISAGRDIVGPNMIAVYGAYLITFGPAP
jgi:hypothetical protein